MSRRSRVASVVVGALLLCRETAHEPAPDIDASEPELTPDTSALDMSVPDPDDELWPTFPPAWRRGDRWRVSMVTETDKSTSIGSMTMIFYGYVVYEFKVAEVPADDAGFYRLDARSIRADNDTLSRYHVYYRKKPFSFAKLVRIDDYDGLPEHNPIWQQPANEAPHPEIHEAFRFICDFPIMPDPPWLGESTYLSSIGRPFWVQKVERTADGLRFSVGFANGQVHSVMDWKRGAPWWSSLGRFNPGPRDKPEMYFDGSGLLVE